jgi:hypothetical protein
MAAGKKKTGSVALAESPADITVNDDQAIEVAGKYIGQWNRLVSTTNWEKGRIICQWRDALIAAGGAVTDYSDEAWSQLVGGVTSQHVGRLRRVFQRFGEVFDQYEGLYWSHFQASLDWEDAEMWLEGAIHNGWSVSQMRGKRWETVGKPGDALPADVDALADDMDDDGSALGNGLETEELNGDLTSAPTAVKPVESPAKMQAGGDADDENEPSARESNGALEHKSPKPSAKSRSRLGVEVEELPDDLADAFEQFKLAIIAQRRLGWSETTPDAVLECLDALRELTLAPADD